MNRGQDNFPVRRNSAELSSFFNDDWMTSTGMQGGLFGGSPWQVMRRMQEDMDRLFGEMVGGGRPGPNAATSGMRTWAPTMDIAQTNDEWCLEAELPGVKREDIQVDVQDHVLTLRAEMRQEAERGGNGQQAKGPQATGSQQATGTQQGTAPGQQASPRQYYQRERRYGLFERTLRLPDNVDENQIQCQFRNGVLTVHLPKTEQARTQSRRIPISADESTGTTGAAGTALGATAGRAGAATNRSGSNQPGGYHEDEEEAEERRTAGARG